MTLTFNTTTAQNKSYSVVTTDIDNFWQAYDQITSTKDSSLQYNYLNKLFLEKGTPGLKAIMEVRNYTAKSYINAINNYPLYWASIRPNTLKAKSYAKDIEANVLKLKALYPELKPANVYFTIGALRTGGTTLNNMVLIGTEIALGDKSTVTSEFPKSFAYLRPYFDSNASGSTIVFTNIHEYVHTQEKTTDANSLLGQSVLEGVAEFMAVKATGQPSALAAMGYARANDERIKQKFATQMFNPFTGFWLYNDDENEFKARDLGYYVGYVICEKYYAKAINKKQAIKEMIALDYNNPVALNAFVEQSGYFNASLQLLKNKFEESRPTILSIKQFKNNTTAVDPATAQITVEFSEPMDKHYRNFDMGPLGKNNLMTLKRFIGFSDDGKFATFEIMPLKPGFHYQLLLGENFRSINGISLKPYLMDFTTAVQ
ncbi:DUF2268 domain-containing protein [Mucilaginibacter sp. HMF5004]|uniref:DUF2268 domain-containing protein n=1 Tax=Mucilaginibacter rivuli TaxID=2857527 RepID=UPI001C5D97B1|nr:DUF2268 domain-containing protein [Mucilaginibacter rivuli]MBW4890381.1 DUF2268 domain-containing protein [Mucilaginibacter rivuli]